MKILLILTFSLFCYQAQGIIVDCKFSEAYDWGGYACDVQNPTLITSRDDREITKIRGQHLSGKNNDDVKYFRMENKEVQFISKGVTKFFKNIEAVEIFNTNLQEITKNDLKEFGKNLKKIYLENNDIEYIEKNVFKFNENLEKISFYNNKIRFIENRVFDGLKKLTTLIFGSNPCTLDLRAFDIFEIIRKIEISCAVPKTLSNIKNENLNFFTKVYGIFLLDLALISLILVLTILIRNHELNNQNEDIKNQLDSAFELAREIKQLEIFCDSLEALKEAPNVNNGNQSNNSIQRPLKSSTVESIEAILTKINDNQALDCDLESRLRRLYMRN